MLTYDKIYNNVYSYTPDFNNNYIFLINTVTFNFNVNFCL